VDKIIPKQVQCDGHASIIDGKALAGKIRAELKAAGHKANLAVVIVGDDEASHVYVRAKIRAADEVGLGTKLFELDKKTAEVELVKLIEKLNKDKSVDGILVQLPLPKQINERKVLALIDSRKDVDGFTAKNAGQLFLGEEGLFPCTPCGVIEMLESVGETFKGRHAVVVGRSNIVGKPMAMMLLNKGCTVTITHSKTVDLTMHTKMADILVVAVGKRNLITASMVKPGATVIDVGINRYEGKLCGDVDFDAVRDIAAYITPVPGGVGPMTIAMVLKNLTKTIKV